MKKLFLLFLLFSCNSVLSVGELDRLAIKYGTDKSSKCHHYTYVYDKYFNSLRFENINFLEIGLAGCASARMWEEYFPNASLFFMDIMEESIKKGKAVLSKRSKCFLADQANKNDLVCFTNNVNVKFDIIIDDGGHTMEQQINSFEVLFPYVKDGGVYVIEDLHTSYWEMYGGHGNIGSPKAEEGTAIKFLQNLVDAVNYIGSFTGYANRDLCPDSLKESLNYYQKNIESVHFYSSLCFIFKR